MFILGINGSPHREGMSEKLLAKALLGSQSLGAEVDFLHLADHITAFPSGELDDRTPPGLEQIFAQVEKADGIIISTPVHWFNVSALTKAFIDYLSVFEYRNFGLQGKVLGAIANCDEDGGQQALSLIASPLIHQGMIVPPYGLVFHNRSGAKTSENGWQEKDLELLGRNVVRLAGSIAERTWGY